MRRHAACTRTWRRTAATTCLTASVHPLLELLRLRGPALAFEPLRAARLRLRHADRAIASSTAAANSSGVSDHVEAVGPLGASRAGRAPRPACRSPGTPSASAAASPASPAGRRTGITSTPRGPQRRQVGERHRRQRPHPRQPEQLRVRVVLRADEQDRAGRSSRRRVPARTRASIRRSITPQNTTSGVGSPSSSRSDSGVSLATGAPEVEIDAVREQVRGLPSFGEVRSQRLAHRDHDVDLRRPVRPPCASTCGRRGRATRRSRPRSSRPTAPPATRRPGRRRSAAS